MPTNLISEARALIRDADFVRAWPQEVKDVLARALRTEGDLPPYAEKSVKWAIGQARRIETRMNRDIEKGLSTLPESQRRRQLSKMAA